MRLFIAADLDDGARAAVSGAVARLRAGSERDRPGSARGVSWVDARNLHLTLHFLGDVEADRLSVLGDALAPALELDAPRVGLAGWGVFPPRGPVRVIWLGVTAGAETLTAAHAALGDRLRSAGITPESRPFTPHLTVGRAKVPSGEHWTRLVAGVPPRPVGEWDLRACTLFQSLLSPAGPTYRALLSIPFAGGSIAAPADAMEVHRAE
ncbi:MAG: RNA 2',3'-cyclic phosphodiesterase [Vicinamibacterales bacterium]|jgi:2'-5' RNA ligase|nr:RNA 2',3'-cyclic phosphodiesterase [Vicinamibacterales bacterium]